MSPIKSANVSPFCAMLRTKKLVFQQRPPRTEEELMDGSGHTWCELSQEAVGPDGAPCGARTCREGRSCFRPYIEGLG